MALIPKCCVGSSPPFWAMRKMVWKRVKTCIVTDRLNLTQCFGFLEKYNGEIGFKGKLTQVFSSFFANISGFKVEHGLNFLEIIKYKAMAKSWQKKEERASSIFLHPSLYCGYIPRYPKKYYKSFAKTTSMVIYNTKASSKSHVFGMKNRGRKSW